MGRNKKVDPLLLVELVEEYHKDHPNKKIKYADFGRYARSKGIKIEDYLLRRYPEVKALVTIYNNEETPFQKVVAYHTQDVDAFLAKNQSTPKLKAALIEREQHYKTVAEAATSIFAENDKLEKKNTELQNAVKELTEKLYSQTEMLKEKDRMLIKLKRILNDYVYPEIANALLQQEGVLDVVSDTIDEDSLEKHTISADTDISEYESEFLNKLLIDFDKDE